MLFTFTFTHSTVTGEKIFSGNVTPPIALQLLKEYLNDMANREAMELARLSKNKEAAGEKDSNRNAG